MTRENARKKRTTRSVSVSITPDAQSGLEKDKLLQAVSLHQQGCLDEAEAIYREIRSSVPDNFDALRLLAAISAQRGNFLQSVELFDQACSINPAHPETWYNYGVVLQELKRFNDALQRYDMAIALKPEQGNASFRKAVLLHEMNRYEEALLCFDRAIALMPGSCEAYHRKGNTLMSLKRYEEAMLCYNRAISCNPRYAVAYSRRGDVQHELGRYKEALVSYEKALALDPEYAEAYNNHGVVLRALNRYEEALSSYDKALEFKPDYAKAHYNRGNVLQSLCRNEDALSSYDRSIALKPDYAEAFFSRAAVLQALGRYDEALQSYERVEEYAPGFPQMYANRGVLFTERKRFPDAIADFGKALVIKPDSDFLFGQFLHAKMHICDWHDFASNLAWLERQIRIGMRVSPPFPVLALLDSPALQQDVARIFIDANSFERDCLPPISQRIRSGRIRLGYFSADFHNHATAYLMAELFERHDRSRFELIAFSFGPDSNDGMRRRVAASFDRFIDVRSLSDRSVAELSRALGIDIAVDLKGFTQGNRRTIFAYRAAPVQVSYLGYPGTMGADYIDYLIADKVLIPESSRQYYTEKIVCLPDSYQVNDTHRQISERVFTREECGLPERGFVFACFNKPYKITPALFDSWIRILKRVEGSVLWLFDGYSDAAVDNLRREAAEHGVAGERLVFAKRMPLAEHLARHCLADLFLDTLPCNAHTTASDALWAGLPVLTRMGDSFAGRVAASLLTAIGLPELITTTQEEYEAFAVALALEPVKLTSIREKLARNRQTTPLFDTERFTAHLEAAYVAMYERCQAELPLDHLVVAEGTGKSDVAVWLPTALALHRQGQLDEAAAIYRQILCVFPENSDVLQLLAGVAVQKNEMSEALAFFDQALAITPDRSDLYNNRANVLLSLKRNDEALENYRQALARKPEDADLWSNCGNVLKLLGRHEEALLMFNKVLHFNPEHVGAVFNRGYTLEQMKQYEDAVHAYQQALSLKPDYTFLFSRYLHIRMKICDWQDYDRNLASLREKIEHGEASATPFPVLSLIDSPSHQLYAAQIYVKERCPESFALSGIPQRERNEKIRLGYYSADFHNHATTVLIAELFERHDRSRFELIAFSFGPDTRSAMRVRISASFDRFIDARNLSDLEVAELSRELRIDIAIDLKGYTTDSRTGIFAHRVAPLQVNYLGYPGTMGAPYIDYLIADSVLIPEKSQRYYTEKIVYLPDSYQVNDTHRRISERQFSLAECGLPESGFVFACFNNNYKITPSVFDSWMRILKQVEGSVLWLLEDNASAAESLLREAAVRGIGRERLVFAKRMPLVEHLSRHSKADLFLDTLPCNAHTTASDALWCGLPILTLTGESFAGRVGASLLNAINLPELITSTPEEYEALAIELATNPEKLGKIRQKLAQNRLTTPLFDTLLFTRHIEAAYMAMYERYQEGLPPDHLLIESSSAFSGSGAELMPVKDCRAVMKENEPSPAWVLQLQTALTVHQQGRLDEAEMLYRVILRDQPDQFDALQLLASVAAQKKNAEDAVVLFERALSINPDHPATLNNHGNALVALKRYEDALTSYDRALALKADYAEAYYNRGNALLALKRYDEALLNYEHTRALRPDYAEAYNRCGDVLQELKRYHEALLCYEKAIELKPGFAEAYNNLGNVLQELKRYDEALLRYEQAIAIKPGFVDAHNNSGIACKELKRYEEAVLFYRKAIALKPDYAEAYNNLGNVLMELKQDKESIELYEKALALKPDYPDAYHNFGNALTELLCYEEALEQYGKALSLNPDYAFLYGICLHTQMKIGDWSSFDHHLLQLAEKIGHNEKVSSPFPVLALLDSLVLQKEAARIFVQEKFPANHALSEIAKRARHDKIRIGYYSADFHDHATTRLMAELFEAHDRSRFELFAFSFGPDRQDAMRGRISAAFDHFFDVRVQSDNAIALLSRNLEIDIAVDLKGFTLEARTGIFALRAAPIQVSYLGYPGTMGAEYLDYLIADRVLIPEGSRYGYTEKIVSLPDSYQVNDTKRQIADKIFTRAELGLPEKGFVFCCFNNNYKIIPATFDGWLRILRQVEGSVLWLFEDNPKAAENLQKEAVLRGVPGSRLIFAKRLPPAEHLARQRLADLFLDTLPCNAHTTASDALWCGLPILTLTGESFAGRVGASLLNAINLPELITSTQEEYEALAIELATNPERLAQLRQKLEQNRLTTPLFNTRLFARHIEVAYAAMYERYQEGLLPDHLFIESCSDQDESVITGMRLMDSQCSAPGSELSPVWVQQLQAALALHQQGCLDEAEALYRVILRDQPNQFDALHLLATVTAQRKKSEDAVVLFDQAIALNPNHPETLNNRGMALQELMRYEEALVSYDQAIALRPDYPEACNNRGITLKKLGRYREALASYEQALVFKPDFDFLFGACLHMKMQICDWKDFDHQVCQLVEKVERGEKASPPFPVLAIVDSLAVQKAAALIFSQETVITPVHEFPIISRRVRHDKIRIGYYSSDFCDHATAYLMAELFELHDRSQFELFAFSFGVNNHDPMRKRVVQAFEHFFDVQAQSDNNVVLRSRNLEIDIAIDLKGFTQNSRTGIFALRAAPIQVSYLGYPGTMGAEYIDYLIADETLIPESSRFSYTEKIVSLPDSYQVNDTKRVIADRVFTREELGLPATGFIFCCFNNTFKITPTIFDCWMRILRQVEGSVLWLLESTPEAVDNLRREGVQRGIESSRLVFAKRIPLAEHLARHRSADLFLDTVPCNAHTTASDALWAGLPLLTLQGESFASRVAASLLNAMQLPELITSNWEEYEALAIELATNSEKLGKIRQKVEQNRLTTPLFDTRRFTQHLEKAYSMMYERYQEGMAPDHLIIEPFAACGKSEPK